MKKRIILFAVAGLFLVCSFPLFAEGSIGAGVCGVVIAAACSFVGVRAKVKPVAAKEADFPFNVKYGGGKIEISENPAETEAAVNHDNDVAAAIVFDILEKNGIDVSALALEDTADYTKIITADAYKLCFCRLKFSGQSRYIELTISAKDGKTLADDPRFDGIDVAKKRFTRIPVSDVDSIRNYADVIHLAYVWGTTTG